MHHGICRWTGGPGLAGVARPGITKLSFSVRKTLSNFDLALWPTNIETGQSACTTVLPMAPDFRSHRSLCAPAVDLKSRGNVDFGAEADSDIDNGSEPVPTTVLGKKSPGHGGPPLGFVQRWGIRRPSPRRSRQFLANDVLIGLRESALGFDPEAAGVVEQLVHALVGDLSIE